MSQLLWGKQTGRFAAPPEAGKSRSPWAYVPIYLLLPITMVVLALGSYQAISLFVCSGDDEGFCVGWRLPTIEGGTARDVALFCGALILVSFVLSVLSAARLRAWPVLVAWSLALLAAIIAVVAFLMISGSMATPVGTVVEQQI